MDDAAWMVIALLTLGCLALLLHNWDGWRPFVITLLHTLIKFCACLLSSVGDTLRALLNAAQHLSFAWYVMAVLTVLAVANLIAQPIAVLYLAAYGVTGIYICAYTPMAKPPPPPPPIAPSVKAHFMSELRITNVS